MLIKGAAIFESFPAAKRDFKYGYKYLVEDTNDSLLQESPVYVDEVTGNQEVDNHMMMIKWKSLESGVVVKKGQKFTYATWIEYKDGHKKCFYADNGQNPESVENPDKGLFRLEKSRLDNNSTIVSTGLIPGLLYQLLE